KGTQFNVAVLDGTTTISLFEGRLEIRDPDGRNVIDLEAGEIAIRSRDDETIRVIDMDIAELPGLDGDARVVAARAERSDADASLDGFLGADLRAADAGLAASSTLDAGRPATDFTVDAAAVLGDGLLDTRLGAAADLGAATADLELGAAADLGEV